MATRVRFNDVMMRGILFNMMGTTVNTVLHNDLAHNRRATRDHTYVFLSSCLERCLTNWTMEQNRAVQEAYHLKHVKTFSAKAGREKRGECRGH